MSLIQPRAGRPLVLAHRGASSEQTENTLAAFAAAHAAGADGVELDVQLTTDGELAVFHDYDLKRLAGRPQRVDQLTMAALRDVELAGGHRVPTLAEALAAIPAPMIVDVELKTTPRTRYRIGAAAARVIAVAGAGKRVIVSSFDPAALAAVRVADPFLPIGLLFHGELSLWLRRAWSARLLGADALHPHHQLITAESMAAWRRRHLPVAAWTVDDPAELRRLAHLGVAAICCNDPRAALAVLARK